MKSLFRASEVVATWTEGGKFVIGLKEAKQATTFPFMVDGLPTEVREVGEIFALQARTDKWRPAPGGVSIGHINVTAGTLGMPCKDSETGDVVILSNNHVMADSNKGSIGDYIYQPGKRDWPNGGNGNGNGGEDPPTCPIAKGAAGLANFGARCTFSKHKLKAYIPKQEDYSIARLTRFVPIVFEESDNGGESFAVANFVDCALAKPLKPDLIRPDILELGTPKFFAAPEIGRTIIKSGRTSGITKGVIVALDGAVRVNYGGGKEAFFEGQVIVNSQMLLGGDSGSVASYEDLETITVLGFAGSSRIAIFNPIPIVVEMLGITL